MRKKHRESEIAAAWNALKVRHSRLSRRSRLQHEASVLWRTHTRSTRHRSSSCVQRRLHFNATLATPSCQSASLSPPTLPSLPKAKPVPMNTFSPLPMRQHRVSSHGNHLLLYSLLDRLLERSADDDGTARSGGRPNECDSVRRRLDPQTEEETGEMSIDYRELRKRIRLEKLLQGIG